MNVLEVLEELDELFRNKKIDKVEDFLTGKLEEALKDQDTNSVITLLNEIIGYYRDTSQYEKAVIYSKEVLSLMSNLQLEGSMPYATTLLNVANAYRASGMLSQSLELYSKVFPIYEENLDQYNFSYASLYNNISLLYQEMNDYTKACESLEKALTIVERFPQARIEIATTHANLAASLLKLDKNIQAVKHIETAFDLFEVDEVKDYHYSAALSAMGEAKFKDGDYEEAIYYYEKALNEINLNVGKTKAYERVNENLQVIYSKISNKEELQKDKISNGLDLCQAFYEEYGIPMIQEKFKEYSHKIAVGLVGEGSDCFGFDDEKSRDHDYGPGFCMWLPDDIYNIIGEHLQDEYNKLPITYCGITRVNSILDKKNGYSQRRLGVFTISDFYKGILGVSNVPKEEIHWLALEDSMLATATNGRIFRDDLGEFSEIRESLLKYYPERVRIRKIAYENANMSQSGQYNYIRMLERKDYVASGLALSEFVKHTMAMVYLLNKKYAPYYKWMHKGLEKLTVLSEVKELLIEIMLTNHNDEISIIIEKIAALVLWELKEQKLTSGGDSYMDSHTNIILSNLDEIKKEELVGNIVQMEWEAFDKVTNDGGRASCQNDWETFNIMRSSQYLTWTDEMLLSFIEDFKEANSRGWNLITEKYGRMMESTAVDQYNEIKDSFPIISEEKKAIIEEIIRIQVEWMEDFVGLYPRLGGKARSIHTYEDSLVDTSYETYLRGELATYSQNTLSLYGRFITNLAKNGQNLCKLTMENTVHFYGYQNLEEAEH